MELVQSDRKLYGDGKEDENKGNVTCHNPEEGKVMGSDKGLPDSGPTIGDELNLGPRGSPLSRGLQ